MSLPEGKCRSVAMSHGGILRATLLECGRSGVAQRWTPFSPPLRLVIQRVTTYSSISNTGYVRKCQVLSRGRTAEEAELRYLRATLLF